MLSLTLFSLAAAQTALDVVTGSPVHTTLAKLAGTLPPILDVLKGSAKITLFAPTDQAFTALQQSSPEIYNAVTANATLLADVLKYHVLPDVFDPTKAEPKSFVKTAQGQTLRADVDGSSVTLVFGLKTAKVTSSATATNGVVHIVDAVLVPPPSASKTATDASFTRLVAALSKVNFVSTLDSFKDLTILAPNDAAFAALDAYAAANKLEITDAILSAVLALHLVSGVTYSTDIVKANKSISAKTGYNGTPINVTISGSSVQISGPGNASPAKVITADVLYNNGVVHVIDTVLLPDLKSIPAGKIIPPNFGNGSGPAATGVPRTNSAFVSGLSLGALGVMILAL